MNTRQRLYLQMREMTAASVDLRRFRGDPEFKELVFDLRDLRDRTFMAAWREGWNVSPTPVVWAEHRLRHHVGLDDEHGFIKGESPADHAVEDDLLMLLEWQRDVRGH